MGRKLYMFKNARTQCSYKEWWNQVIWCNTSLEKDNIMLSKVWKKKNTKNDLIPWGIYKKNNWISQCYLGKDGSLGTHNPREYVGEWEKGKVVDSKGRWERTEMGKQGSGLLVIFMWESGIAIRLKHRVHNTEVLISTLQAPNFVMYVLRWNWIFQQNFISSSVSYILET